jgi:hypothetical protein
MELKELIRQLQAIQDEVGTSFTGEGIGSHPGVTSQVLFRTSDRDDEHSYEIEEIEPDMLMGCGCWSGVWIILKRTKD